MTPQEIVDVINDPKSSDEVFYTLEDYLDSNNFEEALTYLQDTFKCDDILAKQVLDLYKTQIHDEIKRFENENPLSPQQIAHANAVAKELLNKPKCPTCGSTNVKPISALNRGASVAVFGIFSKKINKSYECINCKYTW